MPDDKVQTNSRQQLAEMLGWWDSEFLQQGGHSVPGHGSWEEMAKLVRNLGRSRGYRVDQPGMLAKTIVRVDREYPKLGLLATVNECYRRLLQHPPAPHLRIRTLASDPRFREVAELLCRAAKMVDDGVVPEDGFLVAELRLLYVPLAKLESLKAGKWLSDLRSEFTRKDPAAYSETGFRVALGAADAILVRLWLVELAAEAWSWSQVYQHAGGGGATVRCR